MYRISSKVHGIIDYATIALLFLSPWIFELDLTTVQGQVLISMGLTTFIYTVITKYEYGFFTIISVRLHLMLDGFMGLFLAMSPWIFKFSDRVHLPHFLIGFFILTLALLTKTKPWL